MKEKDQVVIIGGGWAGCGAAVAARKAGARVRLIERTDLLLGLGNVGGIMRNNGRFTAAEENIALGADELFTLTDRLARHKNVDFPGHRHASLYDVVKMEPCVRRFLEEAGIRLEMMSRVVDVEREGEAVKAVVLPEGKRIEGEVFVEATGSTGPMGNCLTYGNGCCMCVLRCPAFGPRVSITHKAGLEDLMGMRKDGGFGAFSGSCKLDPLSLSLQLQKELKEKGVAVVRLPGEQIHREKLDLKVCQQYALPAFAENLILLDTGHVKLMTPFVPLEQLRRIEGFENARYIDPYGGGKGNSIRYLSVARRDDKMKVEGLENLFCAGEKAGLFVGHTEAITTGSLAGFNAVRRLQGKALLQLPRELAAGDLIAYANSRLSSEEGIRDRYTFAGAAYFKRMEEKGLYSVDPLAIRKRVRACGLEGVYGKSLL